MTFGFYYAGVLSEADVTKIINILKNKGLSESEIIEKVGRGSDLDTKVRLLDLFYDVDKVEAINFVKGILMQHLKILENEAVNNGSVPDYVSFYKNVEDWIREKVVQKLPYPKKDLKVTLIEVARTVDNGVVCHVRFYVGVAYLDLKEELKGDAYFINNNVKVVLEGKGEINV